MNKLIAIAASVAASAVIMSPAHAGSPETVEVEFADLDLRTVEGAARFDLRIKRAINIVCDSDNSVSNRLFNRTAALCVRETAANVQPARDTIVEAHKRGSVEVFASLHIERPLRR